MRLTGIAAIMLAGAVTFAAWPAAAQPKHPKTRVVIVKRSYLDAGTEVLPGERKFTDYVNPPGYITSYPRDLWRGGDIPMMPDPFYPTSSGPQ